MVWVVLPSTGEGIVAVELEPPPLGAASTLLIHESAMAAVALAYKGLHPVLAKVPACRELDLVPRRGMRFHDGRKGLSRLRRTRFQGPLRSKSVRIEFRM